MVALSATLWEILRKVDRGGAFRPPYGARVKPWFSQGRGGGGLDSFDAPIVCRDLGSRLPDRTPLLRPGQTRWVRGLFRSDQSPSAGAGHWPCRLQVYGHCYPGGYRTIYRTAFCRMLICRMSICRMHFADVSFCRHVKRRTAKSRSAICRYAFLPTCKKSKCQFAEMLIYRNVNLPKCEFAEKSISQNVNLP